MPRRTVFERVATDKPEEHLFLSERHGVMAVVDAYPKMPLQCVIAPTVNDPAAAGHFNHLPHEMRQKMHEVADAVGAKILGQCGPDQRVITHIEGYGVEDHPHIVLFAAGKKEGVDLYTGDNLGPLAVQHTLETVRFTDDEAKTLEATLDQLRGLTAR